ncbi:MAG: hypothetical protein RIQ78_504, partial [Bacteroidota bacterium]
MSTKNFFSTVVLAAFSLVVFSAYMPQKAGNPWV